MPVKRLAMRHIKEVLRLKWGQGLSQRQIARSLGISRPAVAEYLQRAEHAGLSWPVPGDTTIEQLCYGIGGGRRCAHRSCNVIMGVLPRGRGMQAG